MDPQNGKEIWRTKIDNPAAEEVTYFEGIYLFQVVKGYMSSMKKMEH